MSCWQYAQLVVAIDERRPDDEAQTMLWLGPHQESAENISPGEQTIIQLLNRFDADGWELIAVQEQRTGGARCSCVRRVIAGELAVRRLAARPDVVRKQLYHLATACNGRRGSTVRVLPVGALLDGFSVPGCAFSTYACPGPGRGRRRHGHLRPGPHRARGRGALPSAVHPAAGRATPISHQTTLYVELIRPAPQRLLSAATTVRPRPCSSSGAPC